MLFRSLGCQPAGNFSYYITAEDGENMAAYPSAGVINVLVIETRSSDDNSLLFLLATIILTILALVLIFLYLKRGKATLGRDPAKRGGTAGTPREAVEDVEGK